MKEQYTRRSDFLADYIRCDVRNYWQIQRVFDRY